MGKPHGSGKDDTDCPALARSRDPLAHTALPSVILQRRKTTCAQEDLTARRRKSWNAGRIWSTQERSRNGNT